VFYDLEQVPQSDAFYPQAKSSSSPSDHSYAELNKFEDIASKFEQIPPKHGSISGSGSGSGSLLNLHHMMPSPGSESAVSPTDSARRRSFKSKQRHQKEEHFYIQTEDRSGPGGGSGNGPINVTANPLEAAAVCKQPRATIVVQQVSTVRGKILAITTSYGKKNGCFIRFIAKFNVGDSVDSKNPHLILKNDHSGKEISCSKCKRYLSFLMKLQFIIPLYLT